MTGIACIFPVDAMVLMIVKQSCRKKENSGILLGNISSNYFQFFFLLVS